MISVQEIERSDDLGLLLPPHSKEPSLGNNRRGIPITHLLLSEFNQLVRPRLESLLKNQTIAARASPLVPIG